MKIDRELYVMEELRAYRAAAERYRRGKVAWREGLRDPHHADISTEGMAEMEAALSDFKRLADEHG